MTVSEFKDLLNSWISNSWLLNHDFSCDETLIEKAIQIFKKDYSRWYSTEEDIVIEKLSETPQLIAMLLYRVAREIHVSNTVYGKVGGVKTPSRY